MSGDRLGVQWGFAAGSDLTAIDEVRDAARYADAAGVTDLRIGIAAYDDATETTTREALANHLI